MNVNPEVLVGLSVGELQALADTLLTPAPQARLDDLLARNKERRLSRDEEAELDGLLQKIDQLTILKNRARLTLSQQKAQAATSDQKSQNQQRRNCMVLRAWSLALLLLGGTQVGRAQTPQPKATEQPRAAKAEPIQVPYRLDQHPAHPGAGQDQWQGAVQFHCGHRCRPS